MNFTVKLDMLRAKHGSLLIKYLGYAAACVSSLLVYSLYSMVDGLFVARGVGGYAMSAVNLALPYTNILFSVSTLFAVGSGTIISIWLGQGKDKEACRLFTQNIFVLSAIGLLFTALLLVFLSPFARLLGAGELTYEYTCDYLRGLAPFSLCFIISYNLEILIKADGHPAKAFAAVVTGCLINCVLDYAAIFRLGMGVYGAALATGISQFTVCLIYLHHFLFGKTRFRFTRFSFDRRIYRRLIPLGTADALTEICNGLMIFVFNRTILRCLGADGLVSYSIIAYINTVVLNTLVGASAAEQPLVSFHFGAGENKNCRIILRYALITVAVLQLICFSALLIFGTDIVSAFIDGSNGALLSASVSALHRYSPVCLLMGLNVVIGGFLTAVERPAYALIISTGRGFIFQCAALLVLSACCCGSAIWFAPALGELLCFVSALISLRICMKKIC